MQHLMPQSEWFGRLAVKVRLLGGVSLVFCIAGCGGSSSSKTTAPPQPQPQTYLAPAVAYTVEGRPADPSIATYTVDDIADHFSQNIDTSQGPQVLNYGDFKALPNDLLSLGTTTTYSQLDSSYVATTYPQPLPGWAIELPNQAGGLVQVQGLPVAPMVAATSCPSITTPQTWQFVTIPAALFPSDLGQEVTFTWNPMTETAYGSVDISTSGSTVTLDHIQQFTLPSEGGSGLPAIPVGSPIMASCGPTFYGNTISIPDPLLITDPGQGGGQLVQPAAVMGIGPTGLLVENNGSDSFHNVFTNLYQNALGAGTGAIGLPKPSSAVDTGTLVGAQYRGFIYGAGLYAGPGAAGTGWSSHVASFGFSSVPSSCASVAAATSTLIYGGDFPNDDPSTSPVSNCDFAIDLGPQDTANSGLYRQATVWVGGAKGASYPTNTTGQSYSFHAVAIAGQLNGKYAIFVIGVDSTQPWEIDLLPN
ncbi:hypothetical protein [Acidicapsa ligni]|uniref:hypothetical protein n=1 Tax=Acidicapsa ligni TaxID=542300 RepID=UPI0021E0DFDB|nr:hypothetical protein [Acidicapsa ligni]